MLMSFSNKDKLSAKQQLAMLEFLAHSLKNGFSLAASIDLLPVLWPQERDLMLRLAKNLRQGHELSEELRELGFSKTVVTQIMLAFHQGNLVECLQQLATLTRLKQQQLKKIAGQLSYPLVIAGMMVCLLLVMQELLANNFAGQQNHLGDWLFAGLGLLVVAGATAFIWMLRLVQKLDYQALQKLVRLPILGKVIKLYISYLLVYDIGLFLTSGFSLQQMCDYAIKQEAGSLQQIIASEVRADLLQGADLKELIRKNPFLPNGLLLILETGSTRADLGERCLLLGRSLFLELTEKIEKLVVNIQPVCFVLLGISILGMYLKLLLPMYNMIQGF